MPDWRHSVLAIPLPTARAHGVAGDDEQGSLGCNSVNGLGNFVGFARVGAPGRMSASNHVLPNEKHDAKRMLDIQAFG